MFTAIQMQWVVAALIILILCIAVHEFGHAFIADKLGDRLPRSQGRVTLNPISHIDPIGTLLFPLVGLLYAGYLGFGWGRPVQVQPFLFTRRISMRTGHMLVALAGPLMNILFGTLIAGGLYGLLKAGVLKPADKMYYAMMYAVLLNYVLFFFNLIPAHPLDGGAVVEGLLPVKWVPTYQKYSVYGPFVLMAVIFIPGVSQIFSRPAIGLFEIVFGMLELPIVRSPFV